MPRKPTSSSSSTPSTTANLNSPHACNFTSTAVRAKRCSSRPSTSSWALPVYSAFSSSWWPSCSASAADESTNEPRPPPMTISPNRKSSQHLHRPPRNTRHPPVRSTAPTSPTTSRSKQPRAAISYVTLCLHRSVRLHLSSRTCTSSLRSAPRPCPTRPIPARSWPRLRARQRI